MLVLAAAICLAGSERPPVPRAVDLHADLAYALQAQKHTFDARDAPLHPDRLVRGSVGTLVLPLFVSEAHAMPPERARAAYDSLLALLDRTLRAKAARGLFAPIGTAGGPGRVTVLLSFEGADGFADDPSAMVPWIRRGACFVGLVHGHTNALAGSSTDPDPAARSVGLTERGRALAELAMRHGAVLDGAHASDPAVDDLVQVARRASAPFVVTHTGVRSRCSIPRNLDDSRLSAVAATGGVVGIDLHSGHLVERCELPSRASAQASLDDLVAHLDHAVRIAGIDHVAIGSDLDGGIRPPREVDGASFWPLLASRLVADGWSRAAIAAVFEGNAARVIAWARAHGCGGDAPTPSGREGTVRPGL